MTKLRVALVALTFVCSAGVGASAGCGGAAETAPGPLISPNATLYERLGGLDAIGVVVDAFLKNVGRNDFVNARFRNANLKNLREKLIEQICTATGGPCSYTGKDMVAAHAGMNVTPEEFASMARDLEAALDQYKIPEREKKELLALVGGMQGDIVGK